MNEKYTIEQLSQADDATIAALADLTVDVVKHGASIGFMEDFQQDAAVEFWNGVFQKVAQKKVLLLVASKVSTNTIVGTVQLIVDLPKNQPHRADVAKMHVHSAHRKQGIAEGLLRRIEEIALNHDKRVLVLDTVTDSAAQQLYTKCGWIVVGHIPEYAMFPNGEFCSTTYMYRKLEPAG